MESLPTKEAVISSPSSNFSSNRFAVPIDAGSMCHFCDPDDKEAHESQVLSSTARKLCFPGKEGWCDALEQVGRTVQHITDAQVVAAENCLIALLQLQDDESVTNSVRRKASAMLYYLMKVAAATSETDPYPASAESELLLSLSTGPGGPGDRIVLPGRLRVLQYSPGDTVDTDVIVVERDTSDAGDACGSEGSSDAPCGGAELVTPPPPPPPPSLLGGERVRELSIGAWQIDGFTETDLPLDELSKYSDDEHINKESGGNNLEKDGDRTSPLLLSWINRAFGAALRLGLAATKEAEQRHNRPRVLLIGLGGGTLAHLALQMDSTLSVDAVELNPSVVKAARQCFGLGRFPQHRLRVHVADAGSWVQTAAENGLSWDVILVDLYCSGGVPPGCCTSEFFRTVTSLLRPAEPSTGRPISGTMVQAHKKSSATAAAAAATEGGNAPKAPHEARRRSLGGGGTVGRRGLVAFNCGIDLEEYPDIVANARAIASRWLSVNEICCRQDSTSASSGAASCEGEKTTPDSLRGRIDSEGGEDDENWVDNALLLFSAELPKTMRCVGTAASTNRTHRVEDRRTESPVAEGSVGKIQAREIALAAAETAQRKK